MHPENCVFLPLRLQCVCMCIPLPPRPKPVGREAERHGWLQLLQQVATSTDVMADESAWTQLAHTFFNAQEFIHYR